MQAPDRRGDCSPVASLNWPGASASGAFSPLSGQRYGAVPSAVAFVVSRLRCRLSGRYGGDVVVEPDTPHAEGVGTSGRREPQYTQPALESLAKEPFAIPYQAHSMAGDTGGSSRRPATRLAGGWRSAVTASEAHEGRSGWKPRALQPSGISGSLPLFGGARAQMCVVGSAHRLRFRARHLSADDGDRPADRRRGTPREIAGGPAGPAALDPSGAVPGSPRLRGPAQLTEPHGSCAGPNPTRPRTRMVRATARKAGGGAL
jgi:hypothetical protein